MRLLLLTGIFILQFFTAPDSEAGAAARFWSKGVKGEASFSRTTTLPATEDVHQDNGISTATQGRRQLTAGGFMVAAFSFARAPLATLSSIILSKESFCIPIALRLLFPGHYFW